MDDIKLICRCRQSSKTVQSPICVHYQQGSLKRELVIFLTHDCSVMTFLAVSLMSGIRDRELPNFHLWVKITFLTCWLQLMIQNHMVIWTINSLGSTFQVQMDQDHIWKSILLQEHIKSMLLEQCALQLWSWNITWKILSDYEWSRTIKS